MNRIQRWLPDRSGFHSRQRGQDLIEFGLIVAVVAVLGIAGLSVLGRAEEGYFIPLQNTLSPLAPVGTDDVVHPTQTTMSCVPDNSQSIVIGTSTTCTFEVLDTYTDKRTWPQGTIQLQVVTGGSTTTLSCPLTQDLSTGDIGLSTCLSPIVWSPTAANIPSATLTAVYQPTDGSHGQSPSAPLVFNVARPFNFNFVCNDAWSGTSNQVEVGQPLFCTLSLTEQVTNNPAPPGLTVAVSADTGTGYSYFACFTDDDPTNSAQHAAAYAKMTSDPGCEPQLTTGVQNDGQPFTCTVVAPQPSVPPGFCTRNGGTQQSFVYRRNYDDNGEFASTATLTATAASVSQSGSSPAVQIVAGVSAHATEPIVKCRANVSATTSFELRSGEPYTATDTDIQLASDTTCTISVVDTGLNTAFDYPNCIFPLSTHCNIDYEQPHAPLGTAILYIYDHNVDPTHTTPVQILGCNLGHVGAPPPPSYLPVHPYGAWFHGSWCTVTPFSPPLAPWHVGH